jgi:hypothetical protein
MVSGTECPYEQRVTGFGRRIAIASHGILTPDGRCKSLSETLDEKKRAIRPVKKLGQILFPVRLIKK